jgi:hypothetical protein
VGPARVTADSRPVLGAPRELARVPRVFRGHLRVLEAAEALRRLRAGYPRRCLSVVIDGLHQVRDHPRFLALRRSCAAGWSSPRPRPPTLAATIPPTSFGASGRTATSVTATASAATRLSHNVRTGAFKLANLEPHLEEVPLGEGRSCRRPTGDSEYGKDSVRRLRK